MEKITHNTIIKHIENYKEAQKKAKAMLEKVNRMIDSGTAEKLGLTPYYMRAQIALQNHTVQDHNPDKFLSEIRLINQTYGNNQELPYYKLTGIYYDIRNKSLNFASKLMKRIDEYEDALIERKRFNTMTATEKQNIDFALILKNELTSLVETAGYDVIYAERGKAVKDYDESIATIAYCPKGMTVNQLVISGYNSGLRDKYTGDIVQKVALVLDEDIENSI